MLNKNKGDVKKDFPVFQKSKKLSKNAGLTKLQKVKKGDKLRRSFNYDSNNDSGIKALFLDLDGTVLLGRWVIQQDTVKKIVAAQKKGVKVVFCTGRGEAVVRFSRLCKINQYSRFAIALNGSWIIEFGKKPSLPLQPKDSKPSTQSADFGFFKQYVLSDEALFSVLSYVVKSNLLSVSYSGVNFKGVDLPIFLTYNRSRFFSLSRISARIFSWYDKLGGSQFFLGPDDLKNNRYSISKISLLCWTPGLCKKVFNDLSRIASVELAFQRVTTSFFLRKMDNVIEINPFGVNKTFAIKQLCARWRISRENVAAIGDGGNDIPMIEWAKYGFALGNAVEELKRVASYRILKTNKEGGVGYIIQNWILDKNKKKLDLRDNKKKKNGYKQQ